MYAPKTLQVPLVTTRDAHRDNREADDSKAETNEEQIKEHDDGVFDYLEDLEDAIVETARHMFLIDITIERTSRVGSSIMT